MKRRGSAEGRFLTRTDREWQTVVPHRCAAMMNALPKLAAATLAARGMLDGAEVARLERIAVDVEGHRTIDAAAAGRILARLS
ncbi:hypothetical protein FHU36_008447 [Nonomuraea muscovyensis]|uniref:Uncharacterized protein n=1 Tax=Nonomuraea muscovyensis TaxID=1124761 RepID=A0A7X0CBC2_9ACTN|nr:hypothetical protein [Nonomuraea muscovyensis]MBB6351864.1 hypothetical protein [Nonomuraea muscovyensis]